MSLIKSITIRLSTVSNKSLRHVTEKCLRRTSCRSTQSNSIWRLRKLLGIKWYHHVRNDDVRRKTEQPHLSATVQARRLSLSGHTANARWIRCRAHLNSFPLGKLEETTGTPPYYMDEDYPARPGITEPFPEQSNWRGWESSTLENNVYIWRYMLIVVHATNEWTNELVSLWPCDQNRQSPSFGWTLASSSCSSS